MAQRPYTLRRQICITSLSVACLFAGCSHSPPPIPEADSFPERYQDAMTKLGADDLDGAIAEFTQVIRVFSQSEKAFLGRGIAYLKKGFPDTAIEDFNDAIRLAPADPEAYYHRAAANLALNNPLRAVKDCTQAIRLRPADASTYHQRGLAYLKLRDYHCATADLREAIRLNPSLASSLDPKVAEAMQLAKVARRPNSTPPQSNGPSNEPADRAPELANAWVTRRPNSDPSEDRVDQCCQEGASLLSQGDYEAAVTKFSDALAIAPKFGPAFTGRAKAHLLRGFPDTAIADLREALICDPQDEEAYCLRARARLMSKDFALAAADATEALRRQADLVEGYELRMLAHLGQDDCLAADVDYRELVRRSSPRAEMYREQLARAFYRHVQASTRSQHPETVLGDWETLRQLNATLAGDVQEELAVAILQRGRDHANNGLLQEAQENLLALQGMQATQSVELETHLKRLAGRSANADSGRIARTR